MYIRRVFYDPTTGAVFYIHTQHGDFEYTQPAVMAALIGCPDAACMEWETEDAAIEAAFAGTDSDGNPRRVNVSVDVSGEEPQLVFEYETIEVTDEDPYEIIDILTKEAAADG